MRQKTRQSSLISNLNSSYFEAGSALVRGGEHVTVYVEGYEDIAFWRSIFDEFTTSKLRFEIMTPARGDLAKGKKVVLSFVPQSGRHLLLCVDSDFDYLFDQQNEQSRTVNNSPYVIQTYTYAIENLMCYAPSLQSIAAKATKCDAEMFDFETFMAEYSRVIYPLFVWYTWSAKCNKPGMFSLSDFRNSVRLNYLSLENTGEQTLQWLTRMVSRKLHFLEQHHPKERANIDRQQQELRARGVRPEQCYLQMQGHTLLEDVVSVVLEYVCQAMKNRALSNIHASQRQGLSLKNELSYYNNSLRDIDCLLADNVGYRKSPQFQLIRNKIMQILKIKLQ